MIGWSVVFYKKLIKNKNYNKYIFIYVYIINKDIIINKIYIILILIYFCWVWRTILLMKFMSSQNAEEEWPALDTLPQGSGLQPNRRRHIRDQLPIRPTGRGHSGMPTSWGNRTTIEREPNRGSGNRESGTQILEGRATDHMRGQLPGGGGCGNEL